MTDPAVLEAATRALEDCWNNNRPTGAEPFPLSTGEALQAIVAAVTPLIEAAALERAAQALEGETDMPFSAEEPSYVHGQIDAFNTAALVVRALKEQP